MAEWISVKDRMPEKNGDVLGVFNGYVAELWYLGCGVFESGSGLKMKGEVTHWMPMPEPPKEDRG